MEQFAHPEANPLEGQFRLSRYGDVAHEIMNEGTGVKLCHLIQAQAHANYNFHAKLYSIAGNEVLEDMIKELRNRSQHTTTGRWRSSEGLHASNRDHFDIVDAIEARDPNELERIIVRHIESF